MKSLIVAGLLILLLSMSGEAAPLTSYVVLDGNGDGWPCDGIWRWFDQPLLSPDWEGRGYVALQGQAVLQSYLMISLSGMKPGADVVLWSWNNGQKGDPINDVHILQQTPSGAYQGERDRSLAGEIVVNGTVNAGGVCWGGGRMNVYAIIWVRANSL